MAAPNKLLVLDDDPGVVDFLQETLAEHGFDVQSQTSPADALERIKREPFDLVISDIKMPGMGGMDLLPAILGVRPGQLVLLMTAFGSIDLAVAAVRAGACDFIAKPFKIEALVFAIHRAFHDREMRREIVRLRARLPSTDTGQLVAKSPRMSAVIETARRVADLDLSVLLTGETGTGKGAVARFIHDSSARARRAFEHVNCASLPATLIESELFGVRRGAFTDAREDRPGAFITAADGTLFLDEIGELSLETQAKLLHTLESGRVRPLGASSEIPFRARVIAATNRPLERLLRDGLFRPDLYYRLNVIRIELPPLRQRQEDIVPLVDMMVERVADKQSRAVIGVSAAAMRRLVAYAWPGNVRELSHLLERAVALCDHDTLLPEDLDFPAKANDLGALLSDSAQAPVPLDELERVYVRRVLESRGGNKAEAARVLGINRRTLYRKLR
ncbi:MAG: sigma-54-dependent Fis family transcriptional regulator [Acidobacteria bacterium]|nr:MAG: sigma-54-dependent Fis family transcriptional regulator [Acidobacteriota bacterium]